MGSPGAGPQHDHRPRPDRAPRPCRRAPGTLVPHPEDHARGPAGRGLVALLPRPRSRASTARRRPGGTLGAYYARHREPHPLARRTAHGARGRAQAARGLVHRTGPRQADPALLHRRPLGPPRHPARDRTRRRGPPDGRRSDPGQRPHRRRPDGQRSHIGRGIRDVQRGEATWEGEGGACMSPFGNPMDRSAFPLPGNGWR